MAENQINNVAVIKQMVCSVPALPMRIKPSEQSEMVSQVLYGEVVDVIEQTGNWTKVVVIFDNYQGWVDTKALRDISVQDLSVKNIVRSLFKDHTDSERKLLLPAGAEVAETPDELKTKEPNAIDIIETARMFLGIPYLWGGRSSFGIDCSGFVQTVFKVNNLKLPRDARQQVSHGQTIDFFDMVQPADLIFFGDPAKDVTHVGIALGDNQIIHASGLVRIDLINHQGIFNQEIKKYTHQLRVIKRLLP